MPKKKKKRITKAVQKVPGMAPKGSVSEKMTLAADRALNRAKKEAKRIIDLGRLLRNGEDMSKQGVGLKESEKYNRLLGDTPKEARARAMEAVKQGMAPIKKPRKKPRKDK